MSTLRKLFGSQPEVAVAEPDYPDIVHEIHREFHTAGDKLLQEANDQLRTIAIKEKKLDILKKIGFTTTKEHDEAEALMKIRQEEEKKAKIVQYYKKHYPKYKFITEDCIDDICKKYSLVWGDIRYFEGFIPYKNAQEVKRFFATIRKEDTCITGLKDFGWFKIKKHKNISESMFIVAPQKDFNTNLSELSGNKMVKKTPPDPVVLFEVNNGYLVVTAWGNEASDPMISL